MFECEVGGVGSLETSIENGSTDGLCNDSWGNGVVVDGEEGGILGWKDGRAQDIWDAAAGD